VRKTGLAFDTQYLLHDTGPYHPEMPDRLRAAFMGLKEADLLSKLLLVKPRPAEIEWIEAVHDRDYIQKFKNACSSGETEFGSADNQICKESYDIALLAAGGVVEAARLMMEDAIDNAFCAIRPPGHHAESNRGMGFCYFNNVAVAARYLQHNWNIKKVGIIDYDVHHGNGTQEIFEKDPTVFYYSIHQHPSFTFPGTGREFETGVGAGEGYTKNSLVLPGQGDVEYKKLIEQDLLPAFEMFQPEVILVSTGFDSHADDDMADMQLSTEGFTWIIEQIVALADKYAEGRLISVLEGGYNLQRLPELTSNHVKVLLGI
jgi:acetoin utilization deacetylase AcuC-like enzyme